MIGVYFFDDPQYWIIPWIIQAVAYFMLLRKLQLPRWTAIIPFLAERQFSTKLFRRMRTFYRPFVVAAILALAGWYLDPSVGMGKTFMLVAYVIYGIFLIRLYWRLARSLGKGKIFRILTVLFPGLFLLILGFGRSKYQPLPMKPLKQHSKAGTVIRKGALVLVSAAEIVAIIVGVGYLTVRDTPPVPLVNSILSETYEQTKDIEATGKVISREDSMGAAAAQLPEMKTNRDYFFPDHSQDKSVVVMTYVVGSNLEDKAGLASVNIRQMLDATKKGDGLTFVMEAGGAGRWFTSGIDNESYGRYVIKGGDLEKAESLPDDTCMSEPKNLQDFISWTKENYPADRYMLVLWDHGGGVPYGYGHDDLNEREVKDGDSPIMKTSEVVNAVMKAGVKFDVIGFDACLMQDIEIETALEPYADYFLGSEETEGGNGWFYTAGFGALAEDPGLTSEEFGRRMIASYDPYNRATDDEKKPTPKMTLSFVDLPRAAAAYEKLEALMKEAGEEIKQDTGAYASLAGAASSAYTFADSLQIDLIDFVKILDKMDYDEKIGSHEQKLDLYRALQASVLYRNGDAARAIHGVSMAFPYKAIEHYTNTSKQLKKMSLDSEKETFDEVFSIIAAQKKRDLEQKKKEYDENPTLQGLMESIGTQDFTEESWYVKGFEDYDQTEALVDIPLKEVADGYSIQMPEKFWKIIADCQTVVYQKTPGEASGAEQRYLGSDYIGSEDGDGHPLINMDDNWVHVGGKLVCYEAEPVKETDKGDVYTGRVRARLNGAIDIILHIEWDPVDENAEAPVAGHVTGYEYAYSEELSGLLDSILHEKKNLKDLKAGDRIQFLFDYYDKEGNLIETTPAGGKIRVTKQSRIDVTDEPIGSGEIVFGGLLTDVYQRVMTTEQIEMPIE
ncbi:MAG: hypothetical protein IJ128_07725 [Firmicutes bacterium]|nr:hypothetical protein [Bacillota bacterium]